MPVTSILENSLPDKIPWREVAAQLIKVLCHMASMARNFRRKVPGTMNNAMSGVDI